MTKIYFTAEHEYIKIEGDIGTVGISDFAQKALGDVVYVELPKLGSNVQKGNPAGVVESVKSASEVYAPVSGEILEVNDSLTGDPALVNTDAEGAAWFYKIRLLDPAELDALKSKETYDTYLQGL